MPENLYMLAKIYSHILNNLDDKKLQARVFQILPIS